MTRAMNERGPQGPWSVPVTVREVPPTGRHFELAADEATRAAIAKSANLRALPRFEASFDVSRHGAGGLHVAGRVCATVGQLCVVTLDPLDNEIDEMVDLVFVPGTAAAVDDPADRVAVVETADDAPEPLVDDAIDLGAIATEFLILGIDPYPRKAGAQFSPPKADSDGARPFAALEALKKRLGGSQS